MSWISRSPMGCRGRLALVVRASSSWSRMPSPSWFGSRHRRRSSDGLRARSFGTLGAPGAGEGSAHQIAALVAWLRAHGVDFTDRAAFCRVRGMGVGGVATRDFAQGDVIFSLPLRAPVSTADPRAPRHDHLDRHLPRGPSRASRARARRRGTHPPYPRSRRVPAPSHRLGGVVESHHDFPPRVARLAPRARHSLPVRPRRGTEDPNDAHWRAYVDLLPRETDALVEWSGEELHMLRGSAHAPRASARRDLVDAIHGDVVSALLRVDPGLSVRRRRRRWCRATRFGGRSPPRWRERLSFRIFPVRAARRERRVSAPVSTSSTTVRSGEVRRGRTRPKHRRRGWAPEARTRAPGRSATSPAVSGDVRFLRLGGRG